MAHICVIDDKEMMRESVAATLIREDHTVDTYHDPVEGLARIKKERFDLVVTDLKMPRMDGLALIQQIRASGQDIPIIMMTAYASVSTAVEAMRLGAFDYIQKPFDAEALCVLVERALEHARLRRENEALRTSVDDLRKQRELIGGSHTMTALLAQLDQVAASHATVLIMGESGTGKELVAAYLHRHSPRADRPMLCLNCAALASGLLESELFGHERGAFTGADRTRKGRFELADGGTLLLDEISEMAMPLQAKLLRVLQEGEFERVGNSITRRSDVRVIATTNRNLEEAVSRKRFRSDLFYRLNVLPVSVPPLRDHLEDIPELAAYFLDKVPGEDGGRAMHVAPDALRILTAHSWPGNVRELENLCRRAATMGTTDRMTADLIGPWLNPISTISTDLGALRDGRMLEDMERHLVERTLARFNGHRAKSAKALGMGVRTLGMKLKQWREEDSSQSGVLVGAGSES
ncbi:MAG: sigma-54-dependent Fis family transcriptional regulator [Planctomycetes bacterium]|nr:sigma-54-dependent Fis family transcriptional regulator [Planctomycetota bacterium]